MANEVKFLVLAAIIIFGLVGCSQAVDEIDLNGTQWELVEMAGELPVAGRSITIGFEEGEVRGHLGCNSFSGAYNLRGETLEFGMLMTTLMACVEDDLMQQESRMFDLLGQVERAQLVEGQLHLMLSDGGRLIYEAVP